MNYFLAYLAGAATVVILYLFLHARIVTRVNELETMAVRTFMQIEARIKAIESGVKKTAKKI